MLGSTEPEQNLVVTSKVALTDDVVMIEFADSHGADLPAWQPGAHIDVDLPGGLTRQYSLCGDPNDRGVWRIAVLREPNGRGGSSHIHGHVNVGSRLTTRGPRNHFAFSPEGRILFIGGGIGITPLIPMMMEAHARGLDWELYFGGRSRKSMAFADDLIDRFGEDRVRLIPQDVEGFIDLKSLLKEPGSGVQVYCCGPTPLLEAVEGLCADTWPRGSWHIERFVAQAVDHSGDTDIEVKLSVSDQTVHIPAHCSILEILEEHGIFVPASCREGTCGTCETVVVGGIPDHRDSVLDADERASNQTMMICVSRAKTRQLVLEV